MVNVGTFDDHLEYFMAIWYNLWPFGIVFGHLVYFPNLACLDHEKSGNPSPAVFQHRFCCKWQHSILPPAVFTNFLVN
jgi:hypothetical protein